MNLGQAVAVCLYELVRDPRAANRKPLAAKPATEEERERFTTMLLAALRASGYVNPRTAASTTQKVRRLVRRLSLPARDAVVWQGMMKQILWKLGYPGGGHDQG